MRLSLRVQYTLSQYYDRLSSLFEGSRFRAGGNTGAFFPGSSGAGQRSHELRRREWSSEQPLPLWPEWEVQNGQFAVHGPFLLDRDARRSNEQQNTLDISNVVKRWLARTRLGKRRSMAFRQEEVKAQANLAEALALLNYSANPPNHHGPSADALWVLAQHHILGTHGVSPAPWKALPLLHRLVDDVHMGNASARGLLGWIEGSRELWKAFDGPAVPEDAQGVGQSKSLLHHTFAARAGDYGSMMTVAYRHHAGIGTPMDCDESLKWYKNAATEAFVRWKEGPIGGLNPLYTHLRISDLVGGVYGPGASAASTGWEAHRPAVQAALHSLPSGSGALSAGEPSRLSDLLEFYSYHADGGSLGYAVRLARIYYTGSIYGVSESAGRVERDYARVRELALRVTRQVWPMEVANLQVAPNGKRVGRNAAGAGSLRNKGGTAVAAEDLTLDVDLAVKVLAGASAALLGRMHLRGEGVPIDHHKAWMWFSRGAEVDDRECFYGIGLMKLNKVTPQQLAAEAEYQSLVAQGRKSGTPVQPDVTGAIDAWDKAIKAGGAHGHPEAAAALAKLQFKIGDWPTAARHAAQSVAWGSPFEGHYVLATINNEIYKRSMASLLSEGGTHDVRCQASVMHYKHAAERGDWESPLFHRGMRAWELGDHKRALIYWSMAADRGDEAAQNNMAWALDQDKRKWKLPQLDVPTSNATDRLGLIYWTRSAAQGNVDAMVRMGDYYFDGRGQATSAGDADAPSYEKAMACYAAAADRQVSALAYWNMGYLYEEGLGVPRRDFHLAKRYYDMALVINSEAYLPVMLSLIRLHLRALWATVWKGEESAVALFSSYGTGSNGLVGGYTEAEEETLRSRVDREYEDEEALADPNLPETYDLRHEQPRRQHPNTRDGGNRQGPAQPGAPAAPAGGGGGGGVDQGDQNDVAFSDSMTQDEADAMIEGAMIVIGLSALAMLVYARQAAQARAEQERVEQERQRIQEVARNPALAEQYRLAEQQPGGRRYAGGLPWPPDAGAAPDGE